MDDAFLEQFEMLLFTQVPAAGAWQPVTAYDFEARKQAEGIHPQLIKDTFQPKRVLDAGCGPHAVMTRLLRELDVNVTGFDVSIVGSRRRGLPPDTLLADLTLPTHAFPIKATGRADLVLCREVLEHLPIRDVATAVRNLCRLSTKFVYCTTRFHANPQHLLDVQTSDDLDPDHRTMLHQSFLRALFNLEGFRRRKDLEERLDHMKKGRCLVYERA